jgi:hypothetical protein
VALASAPDMAPHRIIGALGNALEQVEGDIGHGCPL